MKKFFFLILTLAIPVVIFLFLKLFGTNTFEVPILFENGIPGCSKSGEAHKILEFRFIDENAKNLSSEELQGFLVFAVLEGSDTKENRSKLIQLIRIQDAFFEIGSPKFVLFNVNETVTPAEVGQLCDELGLSQENRSITFMANEDLRNYLRCGIALIDDTIQNFNNLVLVDPTRKIRGIYQSTEEEQTDRLILELKILKQKSSS